MNITHDNFFFFFTSRIFRRWRLKDFPPGISGFGLGEISIAQWERARIHWETNSGEKLRDHTGCGLAARGARPSNPQTFFSKIQPTSVTMHGVSIRGHFYEHRHPSSSIQCSYPSILHLKWSNLMVEQMSKSRSPTGLEPTCHHISSNIIKNIQKPS